MGRSEALLVLAVTGVTLILAHARAEGVATNKPAPQPANKNTTAAAAPTPAIVTTTAPPPPVVTFETSQSSAVQDTTPQAGEETPSPGVGRAAAAKHKKRRRVLARGEKGPAGSGSGSDSNEEGINDAPPSSLPRSSAVITNSGEGWASGTPFSGGSNLRSGEGRGYQERWPTLRAHLRRRGQSGSKYRQMLLERRRRLRERERQSQLLRERRRRLQYRRRPIYIPENGFQTRWRPANRRTDYWGNRFDNAAWSRGDPEDRPQYHQQPIPFTGDNEESIDSPYVGRSSRRGGNKKPKKGHRHIKTLRRGEWVSVSVEDDGELYESSDVPARK